MSTNGTTRRNRNNGTAEAEPVNRIADTVETAHREPTHDATAFYSPTATDVGGKVEVEPEKTAAQDVGGKVEVEPEKTAAQLEAERAAREDADFCGDIPESVAKKAKTRVVCIVNGRERKVTIPGCPAGDSHDDIREHLAKAGICQWTAATGGLYMPLDGSDKPKSEGAKNKYCRGSSAANYLASRVRPAM